MKSKLPEVGTTIFTVMSALAQETGAINLSQGFPNFPISNELQNFVVESLKKEQVQYAPMPGRLDLRIEIAKLLQKRLLKNIDPEKEITVTAGATQAIFTAIAAVVEQGDEVILFDPAYDCYDPTVVLFGGKPVHLKLSFPDYAINWDEFENRISDKTKLVIFNNPNNPAGSVWNENDLKRLEGILDRHPNIYLISDEVYSYIQFEGEHQSVLKSEVLKNRSFVVYSFGKTLHVTGWKLGYCIAPAELTAEFRKVHQFNVFCVNNTMQFAVSEYLKSGVDLETISKFYKDKRDLFFSLIKDSRFKALPCNGTYFGLLDFSALSSENDFDFAQRLTREFGVASIPVSAFYKDKTDNRVLRFCFAKTDDTIKQAADRLCRI